MQKKQAIKQYTNHILMIEPVNFGYNNETAVNNHFQSHLQEDSQVIQQKALLEFRQMVTDLKNLGINVMVVPDTAVPYTPDSIFPNNWISFHADGRVALYPMYAANRRAERREDILDLINQDFIIDEVVDYTSAEADALFLEGTGSMILDRENKIAYAAISERTNQALFLEFCDDFNYQPIAFTANQTVKNHRTPIYHTNVMMCVANDFVIIALGTIDDKTERQYLAQTIEQSGKEIIEITEEQMNRFAGNMLQVGTNNKHFLTMSKNAYQVLTKEQIQKIEQYTNIAYFDINTIETLGGGSVRCMMAEIFLPQQIT